MKERYVEVTHIGVKEMITCMRLSELHSIITELGYSKGTNASIYPDHIVLYHNNDTQTVFLVKPIVIH